MKQLPNTRRPRGRGNGRGRHPNLRNQHFDSNGPEGRIRGTANQIFDKYMALARDALSSGDAVTAENYFQHAEHYYRLMNINGSNGGQPQVPRHRGEGGMDEPFAPQPGDDQPTDLVSDDDDMADRAQPLI